MKPLSKLFCSLEITKTGFCLVVCEQVQGTIQLRQAIHEPLIAATHIVARLRRLVAKYQLYSADCWLVLNQADYQLFELPQWPDDTQNTMQKMAESWQHELTFRPDQVFYALCPKMYAARPYAFVIEKTLLKRTVRTWLPQAGLKLRGVVPTEIALAALQQTNQSMVRVAVLHFNMNASILMVYGQGKLQQVISLPVYNQRQLQWVSQHDRYTAFFLETLDVALQSLVQAGSSNIQAVFMSDHARYRAIDQHMSQHYAFKVLPIQPSAFFGAMTSQGAVDPALLPTIAACIAPPAFCVDTLMPRADFWAKPLQYVVAWPLLCSVALLVLLHIR